METLLRLTNRCDNFVTENIKKKEFWIFLFTGLATFPTIIYMITAYFKSCHSIKLDVGYDPYENDCYCKNFVTDQSLYKYFVKTLPGLNDVRSPFLTGTITNYKDSFSNMLNMADDTIINANFNTNNLNVDIPTIQNNIITSLQTIAMIPLSEFTSLEESQQISQFYINTRGYGYSTIVTFYYGLIYTQCFLSTFNQTNFNSLKVNSYTVYVYMYYGSLQLEKDIFLYCGQGVTNYINNTYVNVNATLIDEMMATPELQKMMYNINSSLVNEVNNVVFGTHPPKYCIPDTCFKAECFGLGLLYNVILMVSVSGLYYRFFYFFIELYYVRYKDEPQIELTSIRTLEN